MKQDPAWALANQRYLAAAIAQMRKQLESSSAGKLPSDSSLAPHSGERPPALEQLCAIFSLSPFERGVLIACAGMELDAEFVHVFADAPGPTFELLFTAFAEAHWDAVTPAAPLRFWKLIEMANGTTLMRSVLRMDERILNFLTGTSYLDPRLHGALELLDTDSVLPASQQRIADRVATLLGASELDRRSALIELNGADQATRQSVAGSACALAGLSLHRMLAATLPFAQTDLHGALRLMEREARLQGSAILLDCERMDADAAQRNALHRFVESLNVPLIVSAPVRLGGHLRPATFLEVAKPLVEEQRTAWQVSLGDSSTAWGGEMNGALNRTTDALLSQFNLSWDQIRTSTRRAACDAAATSEEVLEALWESCRAQARPSLDELAQRVETSAGWDALVLPQAQLDTLQEIAMQMRHRARVYQAWGFGGASGRGLGITALFSGASGTGKTTAAEALATELHLDLYRVDLSQVVSKYIGETEKSLRRIFDGAEQGGAVLFFDEADALFGRRTEVKDSHDRYANIEVSYLLQRMESYRGLAVLATNMKQALDPAFLRRIRFVVQFPFPDAGLREAIWRRAIPAEAPTEALDLKQLALLTVTGGNIRNIALNAAFLAAQTGEPIRMHHLLEAARGEYLKIERPLTEREIRGWI